MSIAMLSLVQCLTRTALKTNVHNIILPSSHVQVKSHDQQSRSPGRYYCFRYIILSLFYY